MAFPELPDDRRARPRRHRGSSGDGAQAVQGDPRPEADEPEWSHDAAAHRGQPAGQAAGQAAGRAEDGTGRRRARPDDAPVGDEDPPWPPRGRRRLITDEDGDARRPDAGRPDSNGHAPRNGSHANGRPPDANGAARNGHHDGRGADRVRDAYPYAPTADREPPLRESGPRPSRHGRVDPGPDPRANGVDDVRDGRGPADPDARRRAPDASDPGRRRRAYPVPPADGTEPPPPGDGGGRPNHAAYPDDPSRGRRDQPRYPAAPGDPRNNEAPRNEAPRNGVPRNGVPRNGVPVDAREQPGSRPHPDDAPRGRRDEPRYPVGPRSGPDLNGTGQHRPPSPPPVDDRAAPPGRRRRLEPGDPDANGRARTSDGERLPDGPPRREVPGPRRDAPAEQDRGDGRRPASRGRRPVPAADVPAGGAVGAVGAAAAAGAAPVADEDDVDTTALPVRRARRGAEDGDPAGPRPRTSGRRSRPEAYAPAPDELDSDARPEAAEADHAEVPEQRGPVGVGGKLAALTSRRKGGDGAKKPTSFWRELPLLIGVALVLTFLIQTFVAKVFVIPSGSMETTLNGCTGCDNDRVLVDKVTYNFTDITPGDVVVFRGPDSWSASEYELDQTSNPIWRGLQTAGSLIGFAPPDEKDFVKRVIATGGQTVACCDALNQVMVDGQPLDEPYIYYLPEAGPARQIPFGPITVPEGELWMMGDSRNNSADSRAAGHGPVPEENVIGKVRLIVLPFDRFGGVEAVNPQTSAQAAGDLPQGTSLALGMMGTFPFALGRRRILRFRTEEERFLPVVRRRKRWRRS